MDEQVLTVEQMKHLRELGLDISDASMYWRIFKLDKLKPELNIAKGPEIKNFYGLDFNEVEYLPAYTLNDILSRFHHYDLHRVDDDKFMIHCTINGLIEHGISGHNQLDICYEMLCWWVETYQKLSQYE